MEFIYTRIIAIIVFGFLAYILSEIHDIHKKRYIMGASICCAFMVLFTTADLVLHLTETITK
jgi:hypothetical protein